MATPENAYMLTVTPESRTFGTIQHTLEALDLGGLREAAGTIVRLSASEPDSLLREHEGNDADELRALLMRCVAELRHTDPSMLVVVEQFLDAIARARLKALLARRNPSRSATHRV